MRKPVPYKTLVKEAQNYDADLVEARIWRGWRIYELRKFIEPTSKTHNIF